MFTSSFTNLFSYIYYFILSSLFALIYGSFTNFQK